MTSSNLANFNQTSNSDGLKVQQKQRYESMFSQETIRLSPSLKRVLIIQKSKWYNYHRAQTIMLIIWFLKWENLNSQSFELRFISTSINLLTAVSKSFLQVVKVTDHKLGNPPNHTKILLEPLYSALNSSNRVSRTPVQKKLCFWNLKTNDALDLRFTFDEVAIQLI